MANEVAVGDRVDGVAGRDIINHRDGCLAVPQILSKMLIALLVSNAITAAFFFGVGFLVAHSAGQLKQALALAGFP